MKKETSLLIVCMSWGITALLLHKQQLSALASVKKTSAAVSLLETPTKAKPFVRLARGPITRPTPPALPKTEALLTFIRSLQIRGVNTLDFSPDGDTLASARSSLELWNVSTGNLKSRLKHGQIPLILRAKFSPIAPLLATLLSYDEGTGTEIALWSSETGKIVRTLDGDKPRGVEWRTFAFSPDGSLLATTQSGSGGIKSKLILWDVKSGKRVKTLSDLRTFQIVFSPDGKTLAAGAVNYARLWDVKSGKLVQSFNHPSGADRIAFSPDGQTLASVSDNKRTFGGTLRLWNVASGQLLHSIQPDWYDPQSVLFTLDSKKVIVGGGNPLNIDEEGNLLNEGNSAIIFYEVSTGEVSSVLKRKDGDLITEMAISPDGKMLATSEYGSGKDGAVKLWNLG